MRILFLSRWYPYPPSNGSKLRIFNLLIGLAKKHDVTLISFLDDPARPPAALPAEAGCKEVLTVPWQSYKPESLRARLAVLNPAPRSAVVTFSRRMKETVDQALRDGAFDLVVASQIDTARYSSSFRDLPAVFEEVELGVLRDQFVNASSRWRRLRHGLTWAKYRRYLAGQLRNFQVSTVVSELERQLLTRIVKGYPSVELIPNGVKLSEYENFRQVPQPNSLIFTGSLRFQPNFEAMAWFLREVYPRIQAEEPHVRLSITGEPSSRRLPEARNVSLVGFVDDIRPLIRRAWVSLAPLQTGGGTRLKILEAMALGTPVVSTSKGAEGLAAIDGKHILIADGEEAFAQAILRLLRDPGLHRQIAKNAHSLVRQSYDWELIIPRFLDVVEDAVTMPRPNAGFRSSAPIRYPN